MDTLYWLVWGDSDLSPEERAANLAELRALLGEEATSARDIDLEAFLVATKRDAAKAAESWRDTQAWRKSFFPITRTEGIERILKSTRYRDLGFNKETPPRRVLIYDAQWGKFLEGEDEGELISAFVLWFEEQIAIVDSQEAPVYSFIHLAIGGPPPMQWCQQLTKILEANYPERLHRAVIYPVPWLLRRLIYGMLWFLPQRTQDKFVFTYDLPSLAKALSLDEAALPEDILATSVDTLVSKAKAGEFAGELGSWRKNADGDDQTVRAAYVAAGATEELQVDIVGRPKWLVWTCGVDAGYDAGLRVTFEACSSVDSFLEGDAAGKPANLREESRFQDIEHGERFTPPGPGKLLFWFDNSFSWINGKNVYAEVVAHREGE